MNLHILRLLVGTLAICLLAGELLAQQPGQAGTGGPNGGRRNNKKPVVQLPDDPNLLKLEKQFVQEAEKLALEYAKNNQLDKAKACYQEITRFVPTYGGAQANLNKIQTKEATAMRKTMDVVANKGWQDTGLDVIEGKPVSFRATGSWHILLDYEVPTDGIEIPKELRKFHLGSLIGIVIPPGHQPGDTNYTEAQEPSSDKPAEEGTEKPAAETTEKPAQASTEVNANESLAESAQRQKEEEDDKTPKPFLVGKALDYWTSNRNGRLYLRMYDADPKDNTGKLTVQIVGTFALPDSASSESSSSK